MVLTTDIENSQKPSLFSRAMEKAWFASAVEVAFTLIVSNFAILISIFVYMLMHKPSAASWDVVISTFHNSIKPTEIIVYILALIAPAIWIIVRNLRSWRHVSLLLLILTMQLIVVLSTAIIYALSIAQALNNLELATNWAWWCLLLAVIVWYITLFYQKAVLDNLGGQLNRPKPGKESGSSVLAALEGK